MARLTEEGVERQKQQILRSALMVFNKKGFAGTKLEEVAKASGISRSPLYYHFKDKKTLYQAVLLYQAENWINYITKMGKHEGNVFDILEKVLNNFFDQEKYISVVFLNELRVNPHEYTDAANKFYDYLYRVREFLFELIEDAKERGEIVKDADSRVIAENLSAYNAGISDIFAYHAEGSVRMFDLSTEEYIKKIIHEYIEDLRFRYEIKEIS